MEVFWVERMPLFKPKDLQARNKNGRNGLIKLGIVRVQVEGDPGPCVACLYIRDVEGNQKADWEKIPSNVTDSL